MHETPSTIGIGILSRSKSISIIKSLNHSPTKSVEMTMAREDTFLNENMQNINKINRILTNIITYLYIQKNENMKI